LLEAFPFSLVDLSILHRFSDRHHQFERLARAEEHWFAKRAIQQAFIDEGGTLSHHHAVGLAHAPWLEEDISKAGVAMIKALFDGVDPSHQLNPGKIVD
jgi:FAD/FMN-containing dehydrogenase